MMTKFMLLSLPLFFLHIVTAHGSDIDLDELGWPRDIKFKKGVVTIYQPQIEEYKNSKIEARAAIAVKADGKSPVFGAMWLTARTNTDKENHLVSFDNITMETMKFPEGEDQEVEKLKSGITNKLTGKTITMSLDRFSVSIAHLQEQNEKVDDYNNAPPVVYYETTPSVLVNIDGEPILKEVENSTYKYVMNCPYFLVQSPTDKQFYLKGGKWWYSSKSVENGWKSIDTPPKTVSDLAEQAFKGDTKEVDSAALQLDHAPKLIISTKPAELIQTDGEPKFEPVTGTDLLYLTNSENDIIMDIQSQLYYILIAGRWYTSKKIDSGDWTYVSPNNLPEDFAKIPDSSDIANVRYTVPGTEEAKDALLDNSIPQTAEVDRKKAKVEVKYDGNPSFKKIESTSISYAENADKTVLLVDKKYYCVDDAIWFVASAATGPWQVCVKVPEAVQDIPASSPVYNVKYVYVYDYTPDVVYVGYTPGYYGSYTYYGTVIYGTGYWYRPWYGNYYYPRPVTWGFGIHYNPWTGWGFSVGMSYGWITFGWHSYYHGWWGPCGYRYGYRHGFYNGYHHGYLRGYAAGRYAGSVAGNRPGGRYSANSSNIYRNRPNGVKHTGARPASRPTTRPSTRPSTQPVRPSTGNRPTTRENNIYSDRSGNVYKRNENGNWQQRNNGQWNNSGARQSTNNLNRDFNSRYRGNQRANSYSRPSMPHSRPGGMGGRRR